MHNIAHDGSFMYLHYNTGATTSIASINHGMPRQTQDSTANLLRGLISGILVTTIISTVVIITTTIIIKQRSKKTLRATSGIALTNQIYGKLATLCFNLYPHAF